jgi:hypothetical protein
VSTLAYASLAFLFVATVGGATFAALQGLETWRTFSSFQRRAEAGAVVLIAGLDGLDAKLTRVSEGAADLSRAQSRLHESLVSFRVITTALEDARAAARILRFRF